MGPATACFGRETGALAELQVRETVPLHEHPPHRVGTDAASLRRPDLDNKNNPTDGWLDYNPDSLHWGYDHHLNKNPTGGEPVRILVEHDPKGGADLVGDAQAPFHPKVWNGCKLMQSCAKCDDEEEDEDGMDETDADSVTGWR